MNPYETTPLRPLRQNSGRKPGTCLSLEEPHPARHQRGGHEAVHPGNPSRLQELQAGGFGGEQCFRSLSRTVTSMPPRFPIGIGLDEDDVLVFLRQSLCEVESHLSRTDDEDFQLGPPGGGKKLD